MQKSIIVTGASKGIGKAIASRFAAAGFALVICARNADELRAVVDAIAAQYEVPVFYRPTDVSQKSEVLAFAQFAADRIGTPDVLVNNAGLFIGGDLQDSADGVLEQLMATNVYSAYHLTRAFLPTFIARQKGHVFNISSVAGLQAYPSGGDYTITKHALLGFSRSLREELKSHRIRVTTVSPGAVYTASWAGSDVPAERMMTAEDIADAVWACYQLSEQTVVEDIVLRPILGDL